MKRSPSLAPLSRDHQHGLAVAQQLIRATADSAADARARFLSFWRAEGQRHFQTEEAELLRAFARHVSADHEAIVRVLVDHVELRRRAADLEAEPAPSMQALHELGDRLRRHIRHEERVLFPLIEQALPAPELAELAAAIERAEGRP
jgi:hemerythrin-like domain-containing protein